MALLLTPDEIEHLELTQVIQQRKGKKGRPPGITTAEVFRKLHEPTREEDSLFKRPERSPTRREEREILAKCLELMILACMNNHTYEFNDTIRLQSKGGAIGLKVTQALARLYMLWWDRKFLNLANRAGAHIQMYKRYVDDTNIILKGIEPNVEWDETSERMITRITTPDDKEKIDMRTAREIRRMANSISESIQWEEAVPSNSPQGKLPILDLQCWHSNTPGAGTIIYYQFYRKPMANRQVMLYKSAMPEQVKRTTSSQEVIRILRNCHPELPWEMKVTHLNEFMERLRDSGYPERIRAEIVQSGLNGYRRMQEVEKNGGRPINRLKEYQKNERRKEKSRKTKNWYKNDTYSTVLFVPCTPRSTLARRLKEVEVRGREDRGWSVKVVEMGGQTLRSQLSKSNPWPNATCGDAKCFPCREEKGGGNCRRKNVGYSITCKICKAQYHGETSRNMFSRGEEHLRALESRTKESVLWNHSTTCHGGRETKYTMKATGYFMDPLTRQINEAVRIHHSSNTLNRKGEWRKTAVPQAQYIRE